MCALSRISPSVPHAFAWRMALVAMPDSLAWGCPAGHPCAFVLPRSVCDKLLQGR